MRHGAGGRPGWGPPHFLGEGARSLRLVPPPARISAPRGLPPQMPRKVDRRASQILRNRGRAASALPCRALQFEPPGCQHTRIAIRRSQTRPIARRPGTGRLPPPPPRACRRRCRKGADPQACRMPHTCRPCPLLQYMWKHQAALDGERPMHGLGAPRRCTAVTRCAVHTEENMQRASLPCTAEPASLNGRDAGVALCCAARRTGACAAWHALLGYLRGQSGWGLTANRPCLLLRSTH